MVMSVIFEGIKRHVNLCTFIMLNADLQIMIISIELYESAQRDNNMHRGNHMFSIHIKIQKQVSPFIVLRAIPWPRLCIFAGICHRKYSSRGPYYRRLVNVMYHFILPYITLEFHTLLNITSIITLPITRRGDDALNFKRRVFGYL